MNLDEYRAMVAQEQAEKNNPQGSESSNAQTDQGSTEPVQETNQQEEQSQSTPNVEREQTGTQPDAEPAPQVFNINGQEVTLEELQRGYLRQSDYTRKTQDVAKQARQMQDALALLENVKNNPELAEQFNIDPRDLQIKELEQNYYDLALQQEVQTLSTKYSDFEVSEVLDFALERGMDNLEDAYLLNKQYQSNTTQPNTVPTQQNIPNQPVDIEALKAQLRQELQNEMNTSTMVSSQGAPPVAPNAPVLSEAELRIARNMKMSPEEYAKWR